MSKYQEALEIVKHPMKYGADKFGEAINVLEKSLAIPTQDEVCKALSEYYGVEVYYNRYTHSIYYKNNQEILKNVCEFNILTQGVRVFEHLLPPHLVTLIGRFYEGVLVNEYERNLKV